MYGDAYVRFAVVSVCFCCNDTATTEIYTLSLHDALPISDRRPARIARARERHRQTRRARSGPQEIGKHTSELQPRGLISYAVFCLKQKRKTFCATNTIVARHGLESRHTPHTRR